MRELAKKLNLSLSELYVKKFRFEPYIQTILLHKTYKNREEINPLNGTVAEGVDLEQFECFLKFFTSRGVDFIDENDIIKNNLEPNKQYVYLTFDDGYYNNFNCLPLLEKYKAKCTFFISTAHVKEQKAYWWDVLSRELAKRDELYQISDEVKKLYTLKWQDQEAYLKGKFGAEVFSTDNDIERPMTSDELREFAQHPYVTLGNHTRNHINLNIYTPEEIRENVLEAEQYITEISGVKPKAISYPHGFINDETAKLISSMNYEVGVTTNPKKNKVDDIDQLEKRMLLNRVQLSGYFDMQKQCSNMHLNNFSLAKSIFPF